MCFRQRYCVGVQRHGVDLCSVHMRMGADRAGKEGWEQILRFLRHPEDCDLFPKAICIHGLCLYIHSSFSTKVLCKQTL